ncbi:MAG: recombinase RecX [Alphaproteobacteria bacterium]|nr:MAG: recombinase RecX [Alphaproteobacteria bacterium]
MRPPGRRRGGGPVTAETLRDQALRYLARFSSSAANLRRVLRRKVERSAELYGTDRDAGLAEVERLVTRLTASGAVDDGRFAEGRAASLFRRGASRRAIAATLAAKGVDGAQIETALAGLGELAADPELAAAVAYARRRRIGPWRAGDARVAWRGKDLAALARAGFALGIARRVIEADSAEALLAEAEGG